MNIFDPGAVDWEGSPVHTITKEDWQLFRRYKDGERGSDLSRRPGVQGWP